MVKNLIRNEKGNANIILLAIMTVIMGFGMLTIGSYIYYAIASNADAGTITLDPARSSVGYFSFSGANVSTNDTVTIANGTQSFTFEFNATKASPSVCSTLNPGCVVVNIYNTNFSLNSSTNLTTAINANASVSQLVTASLSGNTTVITADTAGTGGNSIVLTDSAAQITHTDMSGGVAAVTGQEAQTSLNNYAAIVFPLFGLALMILGFSVILITVKSSFGGGESR